MRQGYRNSLVLLLCRRFARRIYVQLHEDEDSPDLDLSSREMRGLYLTARHLRRQLREMGEGVREP